MPLSVLRELRLPSWALHGAVALLTMALGYTIAEVKGERAAREAAVDRLVRDDYPSLATKVVVLEIKVAGLNGAQERIERKVDSMTDTLDTIKASMVRMEVKINRLKN